MIKKEDDELDPRNMNAPADDDDEEAKMNKFYALIRQFSLVRDHHRRLQQNYNNKAPLKLLPNKRSNLVGGEQKEEDTEAKKKFKVSANKDNNNNQPSWVPCFKWEDFKQEQAGDDDDHLHQQGNNKKRKIKLHDDAHLQHQGVNLNLAL